MMRRAFTNMWFYHNFNAVLFSLMHIIYLKAYVTLPLTFIAGIGLAWIYYKYPNLILISIAHTILKFYSYDFRIFCLTVKTGILF